MKIICVTGTRADYGIYRPLLRELNNDDEVNLQVIVTGMHVLDEYGKTYIEMEKDSLPIISKPLILFKGDSTRAMSLAVGVAILYFADLFSFHEPDFVLLLGDRGEMMAASIAAHYQNIGILHLHGGERSGSADNAIRHAITKLAHIHFVSTVEAKRNLLALGEEEWRIFPVGSLRKIEMAELKKIDETVKRMWEKKYSLSLYRKRMLVVMHPDSTETISFAEQIDSLLKALEYFPRVQKIIVGANSDAGGELFNERLIKFAERHASAYFYPSIPSLEYLYLMSVVDCIVGNSSSGIIEAPFFQLPAINIGSRQEHREHGGNVVNVPYDAKEIKLALQKLFSGKMKLSFHNPYDLVDRPDKEIVKIIKSLCNDETLRKKRLQP